MSELDTQFPWVIRDSEGAYVDSCDTKAHAKKYIHNPVLNLKAFFKPPFKVTYEPNQD